MKRVKTNAVRKLESAGIDYELFDFLPLGPTEELSYEAISQRTGQRAEDIFKTIVCQGHSGAFYVFVLQGEAVLDFKEAAKVVGEKSVALLELKDLERITGYVRGGCSPIGMKKQFPTILDQAAESREKILVSAGKRGWQILVAPGELLQLLNAQMAKVARPLDR
ncbi:hypothetical protein ABB02_01858 [Clostridiaceae bacterium JG1575]|nr:hypothetical protein ABB02_01858 [Clostridiaceae bacterium JG1575]